MYVYMYLYVNNNCRTPLKNTTAMNAFCYELVGAVFVKNTVENVTRKVICMEIGTHLMRGCRLIGRIQLVI